MPKYQLKIKPTELCSGIMGYNPQNTEWRYVFVNQAIVELYRV